MRSRSRAFVLWASGPAVVALSLGGWAAFVGVPLASAEPGLGPSPRPDIVVFMLDDDTFGRLAYLNGVPGGERLSRDFARRGIHAVLFDRAYVTTPLCCPSRASFLAGQLAHHTGVLLNTESSPVARDGGAEAFTQRGLDRSTLATWLQDGGYHTVHVGKYLNHYDRVTDRPPGFVPPGWSKWRAYFDTGLGGYWNFQLSEGGLLVSYPHRTDADYGTDVLRDKAVQLIAATPAAQPLFLYFAPSAPHSPAIPAPRHQSLRPNLVAPRPALNPAYQEEDVSDKNSWIQALPRPAPRRLVQEEDALYRDGANCLASVSEAILAVLRALQAAGRLDHAVLFFTNDNGWSFLDHRLRGKGFPYEASARVYLVVASADANRIPATRSCDALVGNIDVAPTIADLAGVPIPADHRLDGVSFAPLLRDADAPPARSDLLLEFFGADPEPNFPLEFPPWTGIVTGPGNAFPSWKYIEFPDGQREMYDLIADPFELTNGVDLPENLPVLTALSARLSALRGR